VNPQFQKLNGNYRVQEQQFHQLPEKIDPTIEAFESGMHGGIVNAMKQNHELEEQTHEAEEETDVQCGAFGREFGSGNPE
jgi:hypothetical protein